MIIDDDFIYLKERKEKDIWKGLFDFPLLETPDILTSFEQLKEEFSDLDLNYIEKRKPPKHVLSHQKIYATFWLASCNNREILQKQYLKISRKEINNYPVPKLIENYLKSIL